MTRQGTLLIVGLTALAIACSSEQPEGVSKGDFVVIEGSPTTFDSLGVIEWQIEDGNEKSTIRGVNKDDELMTIIDNDDDGTLVFVQWELAGDETQEKDSLLIHPQDGIVAQTEGGIVAMGTVRDYYKGDLEVSNENADVPAFSNSSWCTSFRDSYSAPIFGDSNPFEIDWSDYDSLNRAIGSDAAICFGCYGIAGSSLVDPDPVTQGDLGAGAGPLCGACASGLGIDQAQLGGLFLCQVEAE